MAHLILDCTESWSMRADTYAGVFEEEDGRFAVAWGHGYEAVMQDEPFGANTTEDGVERFPDRESAFAYADAVHLAGEV